jgi:large subunit ribosomal protein L22
MRFVAKARHVSVSPYKLRVLIDVIRGKSAAYALLWLNTCAMRRALPIRKVVESAVANAKHLQNVPVDNLLIKEIRVDQGRVLRYFKPGPMGRANPYRKRASHLSVVLESINK